MYLVLNHSELIMSSDRLLKEFISIVGQELSHVHDFETRPLIGLELPEQAML